VFLRRIPTPDVHLIPGDPGLPVTVRRSARARRMTLRVSRIDGAAVLILPARVPWAEGLAFVTSREAWLRQAVAAAQGPGGPLVSLPVRGVDMAVQVGPVRRLVVTDGAFVVPEGAPAGPRLAAWLKAQARDDLAVACDWHARALGRQFGRLTLRDTRSRWGSCSSKGDLMFSWRLIMAPPAVLDYVAAHEVAHLARMDHSPAFWAIVERLCPGHAAHRAWLRQHGDALQRIDLSR
jgi:predicted metal-dependent hydrolase